MEFLNKYCLFCQNASNTDINKKYHDNEYGFPLLSDDELFGRLILEINQAGLSWNTILKKKENFRKAFDQFSIPQIANYGEDDIERLLTDSGIVRNKLKINAVIYNAKHIQNLQWEYGSFKNWLDSRNIKTLAEWVALFKSNFKFTGGEITKEFLMSTGYLKGAHDENCPIYNIILETNPYWKQRDNL